MGGFVRVQHRINRRHPVYKEQGAVYIVGVAKICDLILKALLGNYLAHCRLGDMGRRVSHMHLLMTTVS